MIRNLGRDCRIALRVAAHGCLCLQAGAPSIQFLVCLRIEWGIYFQDEKREPFAVLYSTISPSCLPFMPSKIYAFFSSRCICPIKCKQKGDRERPDAWREHVEPSDRNPFVNVRNAQICQHGMATGIFPTAAVRKLFNIQVPNRYHGTCSFGVADFSAPTWFLLGVETVL